MALPENDSSVGHSFGLEFDGIQIKSITEVTGLKMEQDVIEYKSNTAADGKYNIKKLPGRWKAGECTLTRPLTDDHGFDKWVKDSQLGKMGDARKGGSQKRRDGAPDGARLSLEALTPQGVNQDVAPLGAPCPSG